MNLHTNSLYKNAEPSANFTYSSPGPYSSPGFSPKASSVDDRMQQVTRRTHFLNQHAEPFYPQLFQERDIQSFNSGQITVESYLEKHPYDDLWQIAPHLTKVVVGHAAVEQLPDFPQCKVFICENNDALREIPDLPRCEIVVFTNCANVESFPENLLACREFNSSDCPKIAKLPYLPEAQVVKCSGCTNLTQLLELPRCVSLSFENTGLGNSVQIRPGVLAKLSEVAIGLPGVITLEIDLDTLKREPESILLTLSGCARFNQEFPVIRFSEGGEVSVGYDAGGLSRQLLTKLFESLCGPTPKLPTFSINEGKILPVETNKTECDSWRAVGCLLGVAFKKGWTIGDQFDEGFFRVLSYLLNNKEKVNGKEFLIALQPSYSFLKTASNEEEKEKLRCFIALYTDQDLEDYQLPKGEEEFDRVFIQAFRNLGKKTYSHVPYADILRAMIAIKEGFLSFGAPTAPQAEELKDRIQGVLTKEQIKSCLVFTGFERDKRHVRRFLLKWIDQQDRDGLTKFVEAVTGSRTLPSIARIEVKEVEGSMKLLPVAQTCFNLMKMPPYKSKRLLAKRLDTFMEYSMAGTGFQMA